MKKGKKVETTKDESLKITNSTKFSRTMGDLRLYSKNLKPRDYDSYPKLSVSAGDNLEKFQLGIVRIRIQDSRRGAKKDYYIQVDGLMSIVYAAYAKTLNSLRKATIRQKTVRIYGYFRKFIEKIRDRFAKS